MSFLDKFFSKNPTQTEFAELVIRELAKTGVTKMRYDASDFTLKAGEKDDTIFLSNSYANYCKADRKIRESILANMVNSFNNKVEIPENFAAARTHLLPQVRDASYFSLVGIQFRAKGLSAARVDSPTVPIADGLQASLAYDTERTILQVSLEAFGRWGVSLEEAFQVAKDNLRDRTDPNGMKEIAPGLYQGQWRDSYESSRMLLTNLVYRLPVDGDPVAFIPNRNEFCVTGSRNIVGLNALLKNAAEAHFGAHPLSPDLYLLSDGLWQLYAPEDRVLRELWLSFKHRRQALDYKTQKDSLEMIHKKENVDLFMPDYMVIRRKDGSTISACIWPKGVDSFLPKADFIIFSFEPGTKQSIFAPWDKAMRTVAGMMEQEPDLLPTRYRVRSFPSPEQLAELDQIKESLEPAK